MSDNRTTRRELLRGVGRACGLAALAGLTVTLGLRRWAGPDELCTLPTPCRQCSRLGECDDERALAAREEVG